MTSTCSLSPHRGILWFIAMEQHGQKGKIVIQLYTLSKMDRIEWNSVIMQNRDRQVPSVCMRLIVYTMVDISWMWMRFSFLLTPHANKAALVKWISSSVYLSDLFHVYSIFLQYLFVVFFRVVFIRAFFCKTTLRPQKSWLANAFPVSYFLIFLQLLSLHNFMKKLFAVLFHNAQRKVNRLNIKVCYQH